MNKFLFKGDHNSRLNASQTRRILLLNIQLQKLNNYFNKVNTKLLIYLTYLYPNENFNAFDQEKLMCLAKLFPKYFFDLEFMTLDSQFDIYILTIRSNIKFKMLNKIVNPVKVMVETKNNKLFPSIYLLMKLTLI